MKLRRIVSLLVVWLCIVSLVGCTSKKKSQDSNNVTKEESTKESKTITGYIVIEDSIVHVDEVEIVYADDTERIKELGLEEQKDYPSGYAIINTDQEDDTYELSDDTKYTFLDIDQYFVSEENQSTPYTTTVKEEFLKHIGERNSMPLKDQQIPISIEIKDGKIISIVEDYALTV